MEFLNTLKGLGTVVNVCAVIAGGLIGTFFGKKIKESIQDSLMKVLGLAVMFVGLSGALSKMLIIESGRLSAYGTIMMIISLSLGTLIGELINIAKGSRTHKVYIHPLPASPVSGQWRLSARFRTG